MIWGFVDYENIGSLEDIDFTVYQKIFIFCGPKNPNIKLGNKAINEFINIQIIKLSTNGANNLDFHIAYYLGKFSQTASKETEFHIITRDNGFNGLIDHIKKSGRICKKILLNVETKTKKIQLSLCAELTVERLSNTDGRKRPRKEQKLLNWIESQCRTVSKKINAKNILDELIKAKMITLENEAVKYNLKC